MATNSSLSNKITQILLPKKKSKPDGNSFTNTYNPSSTNSVLGVPQYRDHLTDIFASRTSNDSRTLIKDLLKFDPDVSASLHAFLTVGDTEARFFVYNMNGELDKPAMASLEQLIASMTKRFDYTTRGFTLTKSIRQIAEECRYSIIASGGCGGELIFNKLLLPSEFRIADLSKIEWFETKPGQFIPQQRAPGADNPIPLDIANFFVKFYKQNPNEIYSYSMFVSAINTIAARQQVINDLYRIMQKTGYPRITIKVIEEVIRKNAPADVKSNEEEMAKWINTRLTEISNAVTDMRPDSIFVYPDSMETGILNEKGPGSAFDVTSIIEVLNAQNQAGLKTLPTFLGRGESGVNTATVEARVFTMTVDSLNKCVADLFSEMFSLAMQLTGYQGYVECEFDKVELRPETELEPQLVMRQSRLQTDLSLGLISDEKYHMDMYGEPAHDGAPELSGTGFMTGAGAGVDASNISPNSDPLGRSLTSPDTKSAKSNAIKKPSKTAGKSAAKKPTTKK
jgi:hypothetical protein